MILKIPEFNFTFTFCHLGEDCCQSEAGSQSTTSVPLAVEEPQLLAGARTPPQQDASQILELISEIGSNQILANVARPSENDFHPWFWEPSQGRMMTV